MPRDSLLLSVLLVARGERVGLVGGLLGRLSVRVVDGFGDRD
jgi:hypothetical protein